MGSEGWRFKFLWGHIKGQALNTLDTLALLVLIFLLLVVVVVVVLLLPLQLLIVSFLLVLFVVVVEKTLYTLEVHLCKWARETP